MVDIRNEQYTRDDVSVQDHVDTEVPEQAPKEAPEQTPEHIDIPLTEEEITILTSVKRRVELNRRNPDQSKLSSLT